MAKQGEGKGKILVVDDDRLVLATVSHGLAQAGYEVIDADNGDDAILLAREHRPDLALLDIRMEGKSGFDVAAYLREYLHTPFMFLSAFADDETVQQVRALGAVAYLVKPLDIGQIVPTVEAAFANLPAHRAAQSSAGTAPGSVPGSVTASTAGSITEPAAASAPYTAQLEPQADAAAFVESAAGVVPMAVGVLMHRYSLQRAQALERLQRLAADEGHTLPDQAARLIDAVELLARPGAA